MAWFQWLVDSGYDNRYSRKHLGHASRRKVGPDKAHLYSPYFGEFLKRAAYVAVSKFNNYSVVYGWDLMDRRLRCCQLSLKGEKITGWVNSIRSRAAYPPTHTYRGHLKLLTAPALGCSLREAAVEAAASGLVVCRPVPRRRPLLNWCSLWYLIANLITATQVFEARILFVYSSQTEQKNDRRKETAPFDRPRQPICQSLHGGEIFCN